MIYLDSSVALAHILAEARSPAASIWNESLISSRLLEYEVWNRIHARKLAPVHSEDAQRLFKQVELVALNQSVLARALEPFPIAVRTLDAMHLATVEFLRSEGQPLELASFDKRMIAAARALGIELCDL